MVGRQDAWKRRIERRRAIRCRGIDLRKAAQASLRQWAEDRRFWQAESWVERTQFETAAAPCYTHAAPPSGISGWML